MTLFKQSKKLNALLSPSVLLAFLLLLINLSGDHIFNQTNTLKLGLLAFSCFFLMATYLWSHRDITETLYPPPLILTLLLLPVLLTFPGLYLSEGKYNYAFGLELTSQLLCILWCFLIYLMINSKIQITRFLTLFNITILYVCLIGFLEKLGLDPILRLAINPFEAYWNGDAISYNGFQDRIKSTFGNVNYFAGWLIQLIPIYVALSILKTKKWIQSENLRWQSLSFFIGVVAMLVISLALTGTRAAILASTISIIFFIFVYLRTFSQISVTKLILLSVLVPLLICGLLVLINSDYLFRIKSLMEASAWESRLVPWQAAYHSIKEAPFWGYGLGSSYQLFFEYAQPDRGLMTAESSYNHVHSEWLEVLQEGGVVGFLGYTVFWLSVFTLGFRYIFDKSVYENDRILMLGLITGLLAYHIHGLFSVAPRMAVVRSMAYVLVAFVFLLSIKFQKKSEIKPREIRRAYYVVLSTIFVLLTLGCSAWLIHFSYGQYQFAKGLANESNSTGDLIELAMSSEDVYVLDKASYLFSERKNHQDLKIISERLGEIFPRYRNNLYFQAYASYLNTDFQEAKNLAENHQWDDLYNSDTIRLLTSISLLLSNGALFKRQLKLEIIVAACKAKVLDPCVAESVVIHEGQMISPIQFIHSRNKFNVYLDDGFFIGLSELVRKGKLNTQEAVIKYSKSLAQQIGNSKFFIPPAIQKKSLETRNILGSFIQAEKLLTILSNSLNQNTNMHSVGNIFEEIDSYRHHQEAFSKDLDEATIAMAEAKILLELEMDVYDFMRKRAFLNHLIQGLASSLTLTAFNVEVKSR